MALLEEPELYELFGWQLALALVPTAMAFAFLRAYGARLAPRSMAELPRARWGALGVAQVLLVFFAANILVGALDPITSSEGVNGLVRTAVVLALTGVACVAIAARSDAAGTRALGIGARGQGPAAVFGFSAYVAALPFLFAVVVAWPIVARAVGVELDQQEVLQHILALRGRDLWIASLFATLIVPFLEELLFRGFLQAALAARVGAAPAVVITALVFGSLHGAAAAGPVFALALLLGWLQVRTGRLAAPFVAHGLHNAATLAMALYAQDLVASSPS